jgi:manganese oxidase
VGTANKAFNHVSYRSEPLTGRIGLTAAPGPAESPSWWQPGFQVAASPYHALTSAGHGDPATPIFRAFPGDRVVFRLGVGASDQLHSFLVSGHVYPLEPGMFNGTTDLRSQLMTSRTVTAGQTLDAWLVGGAGGPQRHSGDYAYRDARQPWTQAGMWGILRVQVIGSGGIIPLP